MVNIVKYEFSKQSIIFLIADICYSIRDKYKDTPADKYSTNMFDAYYTKTLCPRDVLLELLKQEKTIDDRMEKIFERFEIKKHWLDD